MFPRKHPKIVGGNATGVASAKASAIWTCGPLKRASYLATISFFLIDNHSCIESFIEAI
jgi:hypothetical protein